MNLLGPESLIVADGYGLNGWQQAFLTSRSDTIWGGTAEIQRNIIAERLLGLPKEPRGNRAPPNPPAHLTAREHTPPTSGGSR